MLLSETILLKRIETFSIQRLKRKKAPLVSFHNKRSWLLAQIIRRYVNNRVPPRQWEIFRTTKFQSSISISLSDASYPLSWETLTRKMFYVTKQRAITAVISLRRQAEIFHPAREFQSTLPFAERSFLLSYGPLGVNHYKEES